MKAGRVDLNTAWIAEINDTLESWPDGGSLRLTGLAYDIIFGPLDVPSRLDWLAKSIPEYGGFAPQPYTQLAKVYRSMGRDGDARKVLYERERLEYVDQRRRLKGERFSLVKVGWSGFKDHFSRWTVGYGYKPFNPLIGLIALWLLATGLAYQAWHTGTFAPNSGPVQVSAEWQALITCDMKCPDNAALAWSQTSQPGQDWEKFNAFAYGADLVIPLIDLNQTDAWSPSPNRGAWGWTL